MGSWARDTGSVERGLPGTWAPGNTGAREPELLSYLPPGAGGHLSVKDTRGRGRWPPDSAAVRTTGLSLTGFQPAFLAELSWTPCLRHGGAAGWVSGRPGG